MSGEFLHILGSGETPLNIHTHTFTVPSSTGTTSGGTANTVSLTTAATGNNTGSNTTGISVSSSPTNLVTAGGLTTPQLSNAFSHSHGSADASATGFWGTGTGSYGIALGGNLNARNTGQGTNTQLATLTIPALTVSGQSVTGTITSSVTDPGHLHSIPALSVTGNVTIPGLNFTVAAQTGLATATNTAITSVSGHNNMQPYATVYKIIKT